MQEVNQEPSGEGSGGGAPGTPRGRRRVAREGRAPGRRSPLIRPSARSLPLPLRAARGSGPVGAAPAARGALHQGRPAGAWGWWSAPAVSGNRCGFGAHEAAGLTRNQPKKETPIWGLAAPAQREKGRPHICVEWGRRARATPHAARGAGLRRQASCNPGALAEAPEVCACAVPWETAICRPKVVCMHRRRLLKRAGRGQP
jgi:hypothetical protein